MLGKLDIYMQIYEIGTPSYTIYKNKLKMDERLKCNTWIHKLLEEITGSRFSDIALSNICFLIYFLGQGKQNKK